MAGFVTRFAPSPTGFAHIGNFRTAYERRERSECSRGSMSDEITSFI